MATTLEKTAPLSPVLSDRYALKWDHAVFCFAFVVLFLLITHAPLPVSGPWQFIRLGSLGWDANAFGVDDPSVPLSAGMNVPQLGWLTSSALATVHSQFGDEGVSQFCAVALFAAYAVFARCFFLLSRSRWITIGATGLLFVTANWHFGACGPATFGFLCAAVLTWMLLHVVRRDELAVSDEASPVAEYAELGSPHLWWMVPVLMMVWCNLSGTFLVGMLMLLGVVLDCGYQSAKSHGRAVKFWKSRRFQQSVYLFQLSLLATCLHPLGLKVWAGVLTPRQNPFWMVAGGNASVDLTSIVGVQLFVCLGVTLWIFRASRLRIAVADVVVLAVIVVFGAFNARLFAWLPPVFQLFAITHLTNGTEVAASRRAERIAIADARGKEDTFTDSENKAPGHRPLQFAFSLICLLLVWMGFAFSPLSTPVLGGQPRAVNRLYSEDAPWGVTQFLNENPAEGLVWAPSYWSDWVAWHSDRNMKLFTSENLAALPSQVQRDYERVYVGESSWNRTLDRYAVRTLVIDKAEQERLFNVVLREGEGWRIVFESNAAIVLRREEA